MDFAKWFLAVSLMSGALSAVADEDDVVDKKRPILVHVPVMTVVRGQPADLRATVTAQDGGVITSATVLVKLTLAGKPIEFPMTPSTGDVYQAFVPVSAIRGISEFWYCIHTYDSHGRIADTLWHRVRILDAADASSAAGGASGAGESHKGWWIGGGAVAVGGIAAAVIDHNQSGSGGGDDEEEDPPAPPVKPKNKVSSGSDDDDEEEDDDEVLPPEPPCVLTGNETVQYFDLSPFGPSGASPIRILVCGTCSNATISASTSWGESDEITPYNNPTCIQSDLSLQLSLEKDGGFEFCEEQTISVFANGQLIDSIPWPSCDDF